MSTAAERRAYDETGTEDFTENRRHQSQALKIRFPASISMGTKLDLSGGRRRERRKGKETQKKLAEERERRRRDGGRERERRREEREGEREKGCSRCTKAS